MTVKLPAPRTGHVLLHSSRTNEANEFFSIYLILPAALGPRVYSDSNRNEYQKQINNVLGSRARPVCKADNLTAICEPTV
jgi:hypothetical protein